MASLLPGQIEDTDALLETLDSLAITYAGWRAQPQSARSTVRRALESLALAAGQKDFTNPDTDLDLRIQLQSLPPQAMNLLRLEAARLPTDPWRQEGHYFFLPDEIDWSIISSASRAAAMSIKRGGDYQNLDLPAAMPDLISAFERHTPHPATKNRDPEVPSRATRFVRAFFEVVDPELPQSAIDNALGATLKARKKRPAHVTAANGFGEWTVPLDPDT